MSLNRYLKSQTLQFYSVYQSDTAFLIIHYKKSLPLTAVHCTAQTGEYVFSPLKEIYPCWEVVGNKKFQIGIIENNTISWNKDE